MSASAPLGDHDLARLFPTEGETAFGTWVKAGALKLGDRVSTRGSVEGAREATNDNGTAANDNEALTLRSIERDDRDQRVYNFAVQSLPGEVTHNYLVGDAEWWTHNTGGRGRAPRTLPEQLALEEAMSNPGSHECIIDPTNFPAGGKKYQWVHRLGDGTKVVIHYMRNAAGIFGDFKVK